MRGIFINVAAHGHHNPSLPLVKELVDRGHEMFYFSYDEFQEKIEATGATFVGDWAAPGLAEKLKEEFFLDDNVLRAWRQMHESALAFLPDLIERIHGIKPDFIMHDSVCVWGKFVGQLSGKPSFCSCSTFVINPYVVMDLIGASSIKRHIKGSWKNLPMGMWRVFQLKRKYGVGTYRVGQGFANPADLNVVYTSRFFQPHQDKLGSDYAFVGPAIATERRESDFDIEGLDPSSTIYISLGTVASEFDFGLEFSRDFFKACIEAFGNTELKVIMSIGSKIKVEELPAIPDNFVVRARVPQIKLLPKVKLFITHGGMNSASESIYFGIPMLFYPQQEEQELVAKRSAQMGCGVVLEQDKVSPEYLRGAVEEVSSNPDYRKACEKVGDTFREAGGPKVAVDILEEYLRSTPKAPSHSS